MVVVESESYSVIERSLFLLRARRAALLLCVCARVGEGRRILWWEGPRRGDAGLVVVRMVPLLSSSRE